MHHVQKLQFNPFIKNLSVTENSTSNIVYHITIGTTKTIISPSISNPPTYLTINYQYQTKCSMVSCIARVVSEQLTALYS